MKEMFCAIIAGTRTLTSCCQYLPELSYHCKHHHHVHRSDFDDVIRGPFTNSSKTRLCPEATIGVAEYQLPSLIISAVEHTVPLLRPISKPVPKVYSVAPPAWWVVDSGPFSQPPVAVLYVFKKNSVTSCRLVRLQKKISQQLPSCTSSTKNFAAAAASYDFENSWKIRCREISSPTSSKTN